MKTLDKVAIVAGVLGAGLLIWGLKGIHAHQKTTISEIVCQVPGSPEATHFRVNQLQYSYNKEQIIIEQDPAVDVRYPISSCVVTTNLK